MPRVSSLRSLHFGRETLPAIVTVSQPWFASRSEKHPAQFAECGPVVVIGRDAGLVRHALQRDDEDVAAGLARGLGDGERQFAAARDDAEPGHQSSLCSSRPRRAGVIGRLASARMKSVTSFTSGTSAHWSAARRALS